MRDLPQAKLAHALLALRLTVALVFAVWAADKFVNPEHSAKVFKHFYKIDDLSATMAYLVGSAQVLLTLAFTAGAFKKFTYGAVLLLHGVSTLSSYGQYLDPWNSLLFFAAWPMLAACYALWLLRDYDVKWSVG